MMKRRIAILLSCFLALGNMGTIPAEELPYEDAAEQLSENEEMLTEELRPEETEVEELLQEEQSEETLEEEFREGSMQEPEMLSMEGTGSGEDDTMIQEEIPESVGENTEDGISEDAEDVLSGDPGKAGAGSLAEPLSYTLGEWKSGGLTSSEEKNYYGFTLSVDSVVNFTATAGLDDCYFTLYKKRSYDYGEIFFTGCSFDPLLWEMYQDMPYVDKTLNLSRGEYILMISGNVFSVVDGPMDNGYSFKFSASNYSASVNETRLTYYQWYSGWVKEADLNKSDEGNIGTGFCYPMEVPYRAEFKVGVYCEGDGLDEEEGSVRIRVTDGNGKEWMNAWRSPDGVNIPIYTNVILPAGNYKLEVRSGDDGVCKNDDRTCTSVRYHFYTIITYPTPIYKLADEGSGAMRVYWSTRGVYANGYQIRWSKDPDFKSGVKSASYTKINNTTRYGLDVGSTYYVQVRTWRDKKWHESDGYTDRFYSPWSGIKSIKLTRTLKGAVLGRCVNDKGVIKASWKKVNGVEGYQIRYADNKQMKNAKSASTKKTSHSKSGFSTSKTWYVSIRTYKTDSSGARYYSAWSNPVKAGKA